MPGDIYKGTQNTNWKERKRPPIRCSIIYNLQDVEEAQVSIAAFPPTMY